MKSATENGDYYSFAFVSPPRLTRPQHLPLIVLFAIRTCDPKLSFAFVMSVTLVPMEGDASFAALLVRLSLIHTSGIP